MSRVLTSVVVFKACKTEFLIHVACKLFVSSLSMLEPYLNHGQTCHIHVGKDLLRLILFL